MKILVTGGCGFIGTNFVRYVLKQHQDVHITVLDCLTYAGKRENISDLISERVRLVIGDVADWALVDELVKRVDVVVNFAAESHNDQALINQTSFVRTNVDGLYTLLDAARRYNVRFHQVSTDEVFGELPLQSDSRFNLSSPYSPTNPYSATKAAGDMLVRGWTSALGVRATISNCSNNYGPYQHVEKFIPRQITNILTGRRAKLYGSGQNIRDWIHVEDHCSAIWDIVTRGELGRSYLISADNERTNREVVEMILGLMHRKMNDFIFVADRKGHDQRYASDSSFLRNSLGWYPRRSNFNEGLKSTISWYLSHREWWEADKDLVEVSYENNNQ